jgi:hypothetical protein
VPSYSTRKEFYKNPVRSGGSKFDDDHLDIRRPGKVGSNSDEILDLMLLSTMIVGIPATALILSAHFDMTVKILEGLTNI